MIQLNPIKKTQLKLVRMMIG